MRRPHFAKHWHSAFTAAQLTGLFHLVNKVYEEKPLSVPEIEAVDNLLSVVTTTGWDRRIDPVHHIEEKLRLARAISSSVNDPVWRKIWNEFKVARRAELDKLTA